MWLAGIEAAKVAHPASTAESTPSPKAAPSRAAAETARPSETATAKQSATTGEVPGAPAVRTALRAQRLHRIPQPVHVHAGQWAYRTRAPTDGHRIFAEVGIAGD